MNSDPVFKVKTFKFKMVEDNRAVYPRENKPRLTISAAYIRREHHV